MWKGGGRLPARWLPLLGGETAEHPGVMPTNQFDLAGFCVGVLEEMRSSARTASARRCAARIDFERIARQRILARPAGAARRYALDSTHSGLDRPLADELPGTRA